jgi:hypothetical protein
MYMSSELFISCKTNTLIITATKRGEKYERPYLKKILSVDDLSSTLHSNYLCRQLWILTSHCVFGVRKVPVAVPACYARWCYFVLSEFAEDVRFFWMRRTKTCCTQSTTVMTSFSKCWIITKTSKVKINLSLCLTKHHARGGCITPPFLTSVLEGVGLSASRPGRFSPGERAPVPIW